MNVITEGHLTWPGIEQLADTLHEEDALEVTINGDPPRFALAYGLMFGFSRAAYRDGTCVGSWGYTPSGVIWSLWAPLSRKESVRVLKETPQRVAALVERSRLPRLHNYVHAKNARAVKWIQRAGCFEMDTSHTRFVGSEPFYYFETKETPCV